MNDFEGRTVVVTGGTGFLGTAVVEGLVERGGRAIVPAQRPKEVERFALRGHERVTLVEDTDLGEEASVRALYEKAGDELWASIHLAGGFAFGALGDTDLATWRSMMDTNATTCFLCCRVAVEKMRARRAGDGSGPAEGGRIVNVAAKPALVPTANLGAYVASKAAVVGLTLTLSEELAGEGIWVNAVAPSVLDTPVNRDAMPDADHDAWPKLGEVAESVLFLASPTNRTTRGAVLPVYGRS